jgi:hypothetical protein
MPLLQNLGHYANECPENEKQSSSGNGNTSNVTIESPTENERSRNVMVLASDNVRTGFQFHQVRNNMLNTHRVISIPSFCNPTTLTNICKVEDKIEMHCTAGIVSSNLMGTMNGYGDVWYHADGIANILLLPQVCSRGYTVSFASDTNNQFHVKM